MASGEDVLDRAVDEAAREFGPSLSAAFALGSLAHGGFAPLVSDVDLMLVLDTVDASTRSRVAAVRDGARRPTAEVIVAQAAEFALSTFDDAYLARLADPGVLVDGGPRPVTKAVLFPVRFLYTLATGRIGRNDDAAAWFPHQHRGGELVTAAMTWRTDGIADRAAAEGLLSAHLLPIHATFAGEYARCLGAPALAARLRAWAARFDENGPGV